MRMLITEDNAFDPDILAEVMRRLMDPRLEAARLREDLTIEEYGVIYEEVMGEPLPRRSLDEDLLHD